MIKVTIKYNKYPNNDNMITLIQKQCFYHLNNEYIGMHIIEGYIHTTESKCYDYYKYNGIKFTCAKEMIKYNLYRLSQGGTH